MICRSCGREIENNSLFCNWCGEKQIKERKKKDEIKIPTPRKLASGSWRIYLDAEKQSVTEPTKDLCIARAKAIRAGFIAQKKSAPKLTVGDAIDKMLLERGPSLSPSTRRNYKSYRNNHFQSLMDRGISGLSKSDWQIAIREELANNSPKTVSNAWALITATMSYLDIEKPDVTLAKFKKGGKPSLDYEQIKKFVPLLRGQPVELAAMLGLHSLRRSEIMALQRSDIHTEKRGGEFIRVSGSVVFDENNKLVHKETNKTSKSTRDIPVMIPRLLELLPQEDGPLITCNPNTIWARVNRLCKKNSLPAIGVHGLRRSFCSLAYHLGWSEERTMRVGGWDDLKTVHECYLDEAQKDKDRDSQRMKRFYQKI